MLVRSLITKLGFKVDTAKLTAFNQSIGATKQKINALTGNITQAGKAMQGFGLKMSAAVSLPLGILGYKFTKAAIDAEETASKFGVVFREVSRDAQQMAETLTESYGLSRDESKKLLSDTGDLLAGFGFSSKETLRLSSEVQKLGVDLASFTNIEGGATRASIALTKGLLGETESLTALGIKILQTDVKKRAAELRAKGLVFETDRQARAQATLSLAMEQSKNAIGDYARTSQMTANQLRELKARFNDVSVEFGKVMIPMLNKVVKVLMRFLKWLDKTSPMTKKIIVVMGALAFVIGPLVFLIGTLAVAIMGLVTAWTFFMAVIAPLLPVILLLTAKFILIAAAIALIGYALYLVYDDIKTWVQGGDSLIGEFLGTWVDFSAKIRTGLREIGEIFAGFWEGITTGNFDRFLDGMEVLRQRLLQFWERLKRDFKDTIDILGISKLIDMGKGLFKGSGTDRTTQISNQSSIENKKRTIRTDVTVESNIMMTIPDGKTSEQINYVEIAAQNAVRKEIAKTINANVIGE